MAEPEEKSEPIEIVLDGETLRVDDSKRGRNRVGSDGAGAGYGKDGVKVGYTGIYFRDGQRQVSISFWKPFVGCVVFVLLFVAAITAVIVGVVKWLIR